MSEELNIPCPLCGKKISDEKMSLIFVGGKDIPLTFWECKPCKAVYQLEGWPKEARKQFSKRCGYGANNITRSD